VGGLGRPHGPQHEQAAGLGSLRMPSRACQGARSSARCPAPGAGPPAPRGCAPPARLRRPRAYAQAAQAARAAAEREAGLHAGAAAKLPQTCSWPAGQPGALPCTCGACRALSPPEPGACVLVPAALARRACLCLPWFALVTEHQSSCMRCTRLLRRRRQAPEHVPRACLLHVSDLRDPASQKCTHVCPGPAQSRLLIPGTVNRTRPSRGCPGPPPSRHRGASSALARRLSGAQSRLAPRQSGAKETSTKLERIAPAGSGRARKARAADQAGA